MSKHITSALLVFTLTFILGCSNNPTGTSEETLSLQQQPLFLLGADGDPLGVEAEKSGFTFGDKGPGMGGPRFGGPRGRNGFIYAPAFALDAIGRLAEALDLTEEQQQQIQEIAESFKEAFAALREQWQDGASWEEIREKRKALREAMLNESKSILTDEQLATLEEMKGKLRPGDFPQRMIERRLLFLTRVLDLAPEQQEQIQQFLENAAAQLMELRESSESIQAFHEAAKGVFETVSAQIEGVITADQLETYLELKERFKSHRGPRGNGPGDGGGRRSGGPRDGGPN